MAMSAGARSRQRAGIKGVNGLRRTLRRAPDAVRDALRESITKGAQEIHAEALKMVAVGYTGTLGRELSYKVSRDGLTAKIGYLGKKAQRKAFYAPFLEFGTRHSPAQPYMGPAAAMVIPKLVPEIAREVNKALARLARGDVSSYAAGVSVSGDDIFDGGLDG